MFEMGILLVILIGMPNRPPIDIKPSEQSTRTRLLEVACELFSSHGLKGTTVAELCKKANANIASVNYHFGSKEELYFAAWRHAFLYAQELYPIDGNLPPEAPVQERLRATIYAMLHRVMDTGKLGFAGQMLLRELGNQNEISMELRHTVIEPIKNHTTALIKELVGDGVPQRQVNLCHYSFINQCISIGFRGGRLPMEFSKEPITDEMVELFTNHILAFTLGGIKAVQEQAKHQKG